MPSAFRRALAERTTGRRARKRWVFVAYDQLTCDVGPLAEHDPEDVGIVLVESPRKAGLRPYHKQKLALVLTNLRHFALEQAARGVLVRHVVAGGGYGEALVDVARDVGPLVAMEAAERELRVDLEAARAAGAVTIVPHAGWLTTRAHFEESQSGPPWRMDAFYKHVRRATGVLMERGKPAGGKWSFDAENRKAWRGKPEAPALPRFAIDEVTREVGALVEARFGDHPGTLRLDALPATHGDAEALWSWAKGACLPHFGPFEDAMSTRSSSLFHTRISPLLNLHRLTPARVVRDAVAIDLPLASQEGFVRQILGWREFMHHVHVATDGFRRFPGYEAPRDEPASPSVLGAANALPPAYWGTRSGLACLDTVVRQVWDEGYSHHITRLMILANVAMLLDVSPRALTDWFWEAYVDAYDWVVEPNVLAMGSFGTGALVTTKPYVAGAAYVHKMSDYCASCAFDPARDCPLTPMYWAFLERHRDALADNPRLRLPLASAAGRTPAQKASDRATYEATVKALADGRALR